MRATSYLQDVVVVESGRDRDFLRNDHRILKKFIWDVVKLLPVPCRGSSKDDANDRYINVHLGITRECPRARGLMSKKEKLVEDVRGPVFHNERSTGSRFLGLDEFEGRNLACSYL